MEETVVILSLIILISGVLNFSFFLKNRRSIKILREMEADLHGKEQQLSVLIKEKDMVCDANQSSAMLIQLVNQSPNAIMLMDPDGEILWINQGFTQMYEYTYAEFIKALGKNYRQTSFSPNVDYRLSSIRQSKQSIRYEALNITRTGRSIWTQTALMPILNDFGEITHLVTIDTDIHQRVVKSEILVNKMELLNTQIDDQIKQFSYLNKEFRNLFQNITELYQLIEKTDQILRFIKEISDKTKILGFNASIEANRAGEHGRGFRIITNEIVDISGKTIFSIRQIGDIVNAIKLKQNELIERKDDSENRLSAFYNIFSSLKKEVTEIESSITEFKSLA